MLPEPRKPQVIDSHPFLRADNNDLDERTPLIARLQCTDSGTPYYKHELPWVRHPSLILQIYWSILSSNYANFLLVLILRGFVGCAVHWPPEVALVLNGLVILPLTCWLRWAPS